MVKRWLAKLRDPLFSGMYWGSLSTLFARGLQPLTFLILLRFLSPHAIGTISLAYVVLNFVRLVKDLGTGQALIQTEKVDQSLINSVFGVQMALGVLAAALLFTGAPFIAAFFDDPDLTSCLRIISLAFLAFPLSDTPLALMFRKLDFKASFYRTAVPAIVSSATSIVLVWLGWGVQGVMIGIVAGVFATALVLQIFGDWRPSIRAFSFARSRGCIHFGSHVLFQNLLAWVMLVLDQVFLGRMQGPAALGQYRAASTIAQLPWDFLGGPVANASLPILSSERGAERFVPEFLRILRWIILLSAPVYLVIALVVAPLMPALFGQEWEESQSLVALLAVSGLLSSLVSINGEAYKAFGKPQVTTWLFVARAVITIPVFYFASAAGAHALALSQICLALGFGLTVNLQVLQRVVQVPLRQWWAAVRPGILFGLALAPGAWGLRHLFFGDLRLLLPLGLR